MNRQILFIIFLLVAGAVYLHGMNTLEVSDHGMTEINQIDDPKLDRIIDSLEIPNAAFNLALNGFHDLKSKGLLKNDSLLVLIDFSQVSDSKRLYVFDLKNEKIIKNTYVAHGMQSGVEVAESFSNNWLSYKSSLGLYITAETYEGKHGYSLRLDGLSKDVNDNARKRAIVIHGASYVSEDFIEQNGRLGRSFGCPALPMNETKEIIDLIKDGTCLYIFHPSIIPISRSALEKLP